MASNIVNGNKIYKFENLISQNNFINICLFLYIFFYILGPAPINIYITLLSIISLIFIIYNKYIFKKIFNKKSNYLIIFLFSYFLLIEFFSNNFNFEIISFFRFVIIYLGISVFCIKIKKNNFNFRYLLIFIIIFYFDTIYQYFFGTNILGYEIFGGYRLSSFFRDEPIVGSFLLKISLPLIWLLFYKNKLSKIGYLIFFFSFIVIFLSGERMPLLQYVLGSFFIFFYLFKDSKKYIYLNILIISIFSFSIIFTQPKINDRYKNTLIQINEFINYDTTYESINANTSIKKYYLNFTSGLKLWQSSILTGNGYRYYKNNCYSHFKNTYLEKGCSSHPHNIYIELLSDYGLLGLLFFIVFLVFNFREFIQNNKINSYFGFLLVSLLITFPLSTSQSIFSSYYGSIFFLFIFINNFLSNFKDT